MSPVFPSFLNFISILLVVAAGRHQSTAGVTLAGQCAITSGVRSKATPSREAARPVVLLIPSRLDPYAVNRTHYPYLCLLCDPSPAARNRIQFQIGQLFQNQSRRKRRSRRPIPTHSMEYLWTTDHLFNSVRFHRGTPPLGQTPVDPDSYARVPIIQNHASLPPFSMRVVNCRSGRFHSRRARFNFAHRTLRFW